MYKALQMDEIDAAVNKFEPVKPDHPFYTNFENLRGDFKEREVMRILNVDKAEGKYVFNYKVNQSNKTLLFLAGMRGSGKTSELAKYAQLLNTPECFFVVTCNVDEELDMDNVQYMDILIFQLEKLLKRSSEVNLQLSNDVLNVMNRWFEERVKEINRSLTAESQAELEIGGEDAFSISGLLGKLLGITAKLKMGLSGSYERAESIRTSFKNRFVEFSNQFNLFIEQANQQIRRDKQGQEILFIVDGLEKTMSADTRRRIIMEESNRIRQIRANTIFTLPIELMKEEQRIRNFSEIITFPFIKICHRDGTIIEEAYSRFEEFVHKRVDEKLFDSVETVRLIIRFSGGSPRQLLRIMEQSTWQRGNNDNQLTSDHVKKALEKLGNSMARYLEPDDFELLRKLKNALDAGAPIGFDSQIQSLLEKEIILEYNDGTYKRVNPLVEMSSLYQYHVLRQA
ncbi:MAG TPA: hypothetical protein PKA70_11785 [Saprospiraceae bacterium]|nr:hypothetical protein [Saprospiraceae bacterium]